MSLMYWAMDTQQGARMDELSEKIEQVQDPATKIALKIIRDELDRIRSLPPVTENVTQLASVVNRLTGRL